MTRTLRIGVLISGGGTSLLNLQKEIEAGRLDARVVKVIASRRKAAGVERAREAGLPVEVISRKPYADDEAYSAAIRERLAAADVELAVLAGFLRKFLPGKDFAGRCINIHPSLIPAFCGKGFYGARVHQAVWEKSCKVSGCTVHLVDDHYDEGPILLQKAVAIDDRDRPEDIQRKVFAKECEALPEAVQLFAEGRVRVVEGRTVIRRDDEESR